MQMAEKCRVLTLLQKGDSVIAVVRDTGVSRKAFFQLKRSAMLLPSGVIPKRKSCSGAPEETSPGTDKLLKHEVSSYPSITTVDIKKNKHHELLHNVSTKTIRHRLQNDFRLPDRCATKTSMLGHMLVTAAMKKKRLNFCQKYRHWTTAKWRKVVFSDESTFSMVWGVPKMVLHPSSASRYDPKFTVIIMQDPGNVMVWELSVEIWAGLVCTSLLKL